MLFTNYYSFLEKLSITTAFIVASFVFWNIFAQVSSIKELKNDVQTLKEKGMSTKPGDPWTIDHVIMPEELSKELSNIKTKKPVIYHVGFDFLYQQGHIPGSIYVGPASKQQGLDKLKNEVKEIKHDQDIVIYCGCCPWKDCPNIRQAYKTLKDLGFINVKVLYIPDTFVKDWKNKGYAVEK